MVRQTAPAKHYAVCPGETVFADVDRFGGLPAGFEIDAMRDDLRSKSTDGGKRADAHTRGAIDEMPAAYPRMCLDDQLRAPVRLMREMPARPRGKAGNPIQLSDNGVSAEMQQVDVLANGKVPDAGVLFHDQAARKNPAEADAAAGMD